jgi:aspartyl protease family protein
MAKYRYRLHRIILDMKNSTGAYLIGFGIGFLSSCAGATEVDVVALTSGKATLVIDGGKPRTLRAGESGAGGVKLIRADSESAIVEIGGKRRTLRMGEHISGNAPASDRASVTLISDSSGHFITTGTINGATVRFMVDTGATMVSMGVDDARRAGINYLAGERGYSQTANGAAPVYRVKLDNVRLGDITISNVDGLVHETANLPLVLLGMSFLGRLEMKHQGDSLTLVRRF